LKFDELDPEALEYMRDTLCETEFFHELDAVDKIQVLNVAMDAISLYLEGLYVNLTANGGNSNIH